MRSIFFREQPGRIYYSFKCSFLMTRWPVGIYPTVTVASVPKGTLTRTFSGWLWAVARS